MCGKKKQTATRRIEGGCQSAQGLEEKEGLSQGQLSSNTKWHTTHTVSHSTASSYKVCPWLQGNKSEHNLIRFEQNHTKKLWICKKNKIKIRMLKIKTSKRRGKKKPFKVDK